MGEVMELIEAERRRQIESEGWTPEHDDEHDSGEMLRAGVIYMNFGTDHASSLREDGAPMGWPWDAKWWKPKDRQRNLERAGALMLAEKERLARVRVQGPLRQIASQPSPVSTFTHGAPSHHVDQKLAIVVRELTALLEPKP